MDKYNLSSIGNYTTITLIKRAKYNRNICKTHKQLRFRIQHKKKKVDELMIYHSKLSSTIYEILQIISSLLLGHRLFIICHLEKKY